MANRAKTAVGVVGMVVSAVVLGGCMSMRDDSMMMKKDDGAMMQKDDGTMMKKKDDGAMMNDSPMETK